MSLLRWMCVLALACALGCGDDSGGSDGGAAGDGDGDGDNVPEPIAEEVSAEDGAEIDTQGASINIPGGALAEDTTITVEVILASDVPDQERLASLVYEFGPDGTTFSEPVELRIALNAEIPDGMEAQLAWLDESADAWEPLEDSRVEGDEVVASTLHFTKFAIVLMGGEQVAGMCEDFEDWQPCGGDIEGTWSFALACADVGIEDIFGDDETFANCAGLTLTIDVDISGTVTFEGSGDYSSELMRETAFEITIPTSCLPTGATCADLQEAQEVDGNCVIAMAEPEVTETEMGTYELEGDTLIMMDAMDTDPAEPEGYCVEGDTITVRNVSVDDETGEESVMYIQATRQ